jgi:eukaryotic-like serine/threonine-protein kinase
MFRYFKSRGFFITMAATLGVFVLVYLLFFFVFLPFYTNHGKETSVPRVSKMPLERAISTLEAAGLGYEVVDSLFLTGQDPLSVISQDPVGGSKVKPGRRVYLTVNKTVAPVVKFPDINSVSQYEAKLKLEGAGLALGRVTFQVHEYADLVLSAKFKDKKLKEGDEVRKGSRIDLTVGKGRGTHRVPMPSLVGESYETAMATLFRLGLSPAKPVFDPASTKPVGTVIQQYPKYAEGDSIQVGREVDLWFSGPEPEDVIEGGDGTVTGTGAEE